MSKPNFDLIVIGTGSAASTVAMRCRRAGWSVAIVDSRPFGGTCALRGCDPKKVLVGAAEVVDWVRRMTGKGIRAEQLRIAWPELMEFKRTFTEPVPNQREQAFSKAGVAAFHGRAHFVGPAAVQVGNDRLEARFVVIATGQKPVLVRPHDNASRHLAFRSQGDRPSPHSILSIKVARPRVVVIAESV
jgi:glutathione reductase (NADPH)